MGGLHTRAVEQWGDEPLTVLFGGAHILLTDGYGVYEVAHQSRPRVTL